MATWEAAVVRLEGVAQGDATEKIKSIQRSSVCHSISGLGPLGADCAEVRG